jgi:S1-C subfamily serine protease
MKRKLIIIAGAAFVLACMGNNLAQAQDVAAATKKVFAEHQDSVVWVSVVGKFSISSPGGGNTQNREEKMEALATVVTSDGLLVSALSLVDPTSLISGREMRTAGGGRIKVDATAEIQEVQIIMPDGTEVPAEVVMKDVDLDLVFIRAKADSKEAKGVTFKPIDLKNSAKVGIADEVVTVTRAGEILNRQPGVMHGQVTTLVKKPREFVKTEYASPGTPTFTLDDKLVGICVTRHSSRGNPTAVLLPAADVLEIAEQAKTAKPLAKDAAKDATKDAAKDTKKETSKEEKSKNE